MKKKIPVRKLLSPAYRAGKGFINSHIALTFFTVLFCLLSISNAHAQTVQLNWIGHWKDEDKRSDLINEVKKEFEFLYPDARVNFKYGVDLEAEGDDYKWKTASTIVEMIQSGNIKWDVVFLDIIVYKYVAELLHDPLWGRKHLVDFSGVPGFVQTQKEFILNDPFFKDQTGGIFIGPYIEGLFYCFWHNKKVAQQTGITIPSRLMKVDDLMTYASKLSEYNRINNTTIPLIRLGTWNRLDTLFEYLFRSQFDNPDSAIEESFSKIKEKAFLDTLLIFEKLSQFQPILNSDRTTLLWDEWKNGFLDDMGLFIVAGSFMYNHFKASGPEKYKKVEPVEYPVVKKSQGNVGLYTPIFAVMKNSPNKKAALDLMTLWSEAKVAEKWVAYTRNPTGIKGNLDQPVFKALTDDVYSRFVTDMTESYQDLPMRYYQQPSYVFGKDSPVTASEFRENLALILEGKQTAAEYFNDISSRYRK